MNEDKYLTNEEFTGIITSAKMQALITAMSLDKSGGPKSLLCLLGSVYGTLSAVAHLCSGSDLSEYEGMSKGANKATIAFAALMTLRCLVPSKDGVLCNYGPHSIKTAIDECEKLFGENPSKYLMDVIVEAANNSDPSKALRVLAKGSSRLN